MFQQKTATKMLGSILLLCALVFTGIAGANARSGDEGQVTPQVVAQMRQLANQGDAEAQYYMCIIFHEGLGGNRKDMTQAATWCRKAADQGYMDAQTMLGTLYARGQGVEQNMAQARLWFGKAAAQGDADAKAALDAITRAEVRAAGQQHGGTAQNAAPAQQSGDINSMKYGRETPQNPAPAPRANPAAQLPRNVDSPVAGFTLQQTVDYINQNKPWDGFKLGNDNAGRTDYHQGIMKIQNGCTLATNSSTVATSYNGYDPSYGEYGSRTERKGGDFTLDLAAIDPRSIGFANKDDILYIVEKRLNGTDDDYYILYITGHIGLFTSYRYGGYGKKGVNIAKAFIHAASLCYRGGSDPASLEADALSSLVVPHTRFW